MKVLIDVPKEWRKCKISFLKDCIGNGIALDGLTNGEVIQKMFEISDAHGRTTTMFAHTKDDKLLTADVDWWNRKWGEEA